MKVLKFDCWFDAGNVCDQ